MKVKDASVNLANLHPAMAPVFLILDAVAKEFGLEEATITSGQDGSHMGGSKHHQDRPDLPGEAVDARLRDVLEAFCGRVKELLGGQYPRAYDVVLEMTPTTCPKCGASLKGTHCHVEYDPKDPT